MAVTAALVGDTTLDLTPWLRSDALAFPDPAPDARIRVISFGLDLRAADADTLWDGVSRAIRAQLRLAEQAAGERGRGTPVVLRLGINTSTTVEFDLYGGTLQDNLPRVLPLQEDAQLDLICAPLGRGAAVTLAVTGTIDAADGAPGEPGGTAGHSAVYVAGVPGDEPPLTQLLMVDTSPSVVINGWQIGVRSDATLAAGDFDALLPLTAIAPGVGAADATAIGGTRSRVMTSIDWQTVAGATVPTAAAHRGRFHAFLRARDANTLGTPTDVSTSSSSIGGSLTGGSYALRVTALDASGNETAASATVIRVIGASATTARINLSWTDHGTATNHRVYYSHDGAAWQYKATGSGTAGYTLTSESGGTAGDPPTDTQIPASQLRLRYGLASGNSLFATRPVSAVVGQGKWEWLYCGLLDGPPAAQQEGQGARLWTVQAQAKSGGSNSNNLDVDAVALLPADEGFVTLAYRASDGTPLNLATKREWLLDLNRWGITSCVLRDTATQAEAGQVFDLTGRLALGPGDNLLMFLPSIAGGESSIGATWTVVVRYVPRYRSLTGGV